MAGDAVLAGAIRIPRRDVGHEDRCLDQATVLDPVLDLNVLRPVDGGDQGDVARLQTADVHDRGCRIPPGRARRVKGISDVS